MKIKNNPMSLRYKIYRIKMYCKLLNQNNIHKQNSNLEVRQMTQYKKRKIENLRLKK